MAKKVWEGVDDAVAGKISPDIKRALKETKITILTKKQLEGRKYTKTYVEDGFDLLENLLIVRQYVCKKYGFEFRLLELLLHLFPKPYFTQPEYYDMPKALIYSKLQYMVRHNYVSVISKGNSRTGKIFSLSPKARLIVKSFYRMLSGDKRIPENPALNPLARPNVNKIDDVRMNFIRKINRIALEEKEKSANE